MLRWRHDYFACQHHIYLFWVPPTTHLLILQVEQVDVISMGKDIAIFFWYEMRCAEFLRIFFGIPNFGIRILIRQFFNSGILKQICNWNLQNQKRNNSASDGGPRNWNQKSEFSTKYRRRESHQLSVWPWHSHSRHDSLQKPDKQHYLDTGSMLHHVG